MSEELQGGDAVLCMPRDLFQAAAGHSASSVVPTQKQAEKRKAMQDLCLLLPPPSRHHGTPSQAFRSVPSSISSKDSVVPPESRAMTNCTAASSTAAVSLHGRTYAGTISRRWTFQVIASLSAKPCSLASDVITAMDFDETGSRFATGGIARKIRICSYASLISDHENSEVAWGKEAIDERDFDEQQQLLGPHGTGRSFGYSRSQRGIMRKKSESNGAMVKNHDQAALRILCTPAKLSSLKWRPLSSNVIGCGDYDGVVTEWDVEQGLCLSERYEHSGQRIWSVDYGSWFPMLCASASGDGTVRLWTLNCERSVGIIRSPGRNSICCAEFSANGSHRVAVACADSNVYIYDVRRLDSSLLCLRGHERAASYVRFLGGEELVSASIDSTVKMWDVSNVASHKSQVKRHAVAGALTPASFFSGGLASEDENCLRECSDEWRLRKTFNKHRNVKNFVGLSVWKEGGLIACGSESDEVFVYERSRDDPVWRMKFPSGCWPPTKAVHHITQGEEEAQISKRGDSNCFVGAVCWRQQGDHLSLLTANSQGTIQLVKVCSNSSG